MRKAVRGRERYGVGGREYVRRPHGEGGCARWNSLTRSLARNGGGDEGQRGVG